MSAILGGVLAGAAVVWIIYSIGLKQAGGLLTGVAILVAIIGAFWSGCTSFFQGVQNPSNWHSPSGSHASPPKNLMKPEEIEAAFMIGPGAFFDKGWINDDYKVAVTYDVEALQGKPLFTGLNLAYADRCRIKWPNAPGSRWQNMYVFAGGEGSDLVGLGREKNLVVQPQAGCVFLKSKYDENTAVSPLLTLERQDAPDGKARLLMHWPRITNPGEILEGGVLHLQINGIPVHWRMTIEFLKAQRVDEYITDAEWLREDVRIGIGSNPQKDLHRVPRPKYEWISQQVDAQGPLHIKCPSFSALLYLALEVGS